MTFWRDQRVVVTGGAGFLGSYIVEKLHARGTAEVTVPRVEEYDLRDLVAIRRLLADARPDIIARRIVSNTVSTRSSCCR